MTGDDDEDERAVRAALNPASFDRLDQAVAKQRRRYRPPYAANNVVPLREPANAQDHCDAVVTKAAQPKPEQEPAPAPDGGGERRLVPINAAAATRKPSKGETPDWEPHERPLHISAFVAHSPDHTFIHRPTGATWTATSVNARVMPIRGGEGPMSASMWLDRNNAVEQRTWLPGAPQIIKDKLVSEGGFIDQMGARVFNLYRPPEKIIVPASRDIKFWRDHLDALWPDQAGRIEQWFAHRAQRPGEKINHALVLGGAPGIGKDAVIEPLKRAVGSWNFTEISPQAVLGNFNEFARAVVLRISEGKDLGDIDRFAFYEATKTLLAAPPDVLRVNPKYISPYYVVNVVGVIITTNHKVGGLFLPSDDRRHDVAWSTREPTDFSPDYWAKYWQRLDAGGREAVAAHLMRLDLKGFNPKAPPPRTQAFWEMVNAMRSEEESEMADIIEALKHPRALMIADLIDCAEHLGSRYAPFVAFLRDRKNARLVAIRLEDCGYRRLANPHEHAGRWRINGQRTGVFIPHRLTDRQGFDAIEARGGSSDEGL
jgi:hypothetical protein